MDKSLRGLQADTIAINALTESRLRKLVNDFDGALRHAISAYQAAVQGNSNYIAHAFDAMTEALDAAERASTHVADSVTAELRRLILAYPRLGEDPRAIAVKTLLDRL